MEDSQKEVKAENRTWDWEAEERQEWKPKETRGKWEPEYLPKEMLRKAGLENETLTIEDVRHELYVSETDIVAMRGRLKQREREYDKIRSSMRTSMVMAVICFFVLLFALSLQKSVVQAGKSFAPEKSEESDRSSGQSAGTGLSADQLLEIETELSLDQLLEKSLHSAAGEEDIISEEKIVFAVVAAFSTIILVASAAGLCWFGYKAIRGHYQYFREGESEQARLLSEQTGKPNLSEEIFLMQLQVAKKEERIRRLKQLRTIYRENLQRSIQESPRKKPQKSIYDE